MILHYLCVQLPFYTQVEVVWEDFSFELQEGLGVWVAEPPKPLRFEYIGFQQVMMALLAIPA